MISNRIRALYRRHFRDARRERMFLASLCFFVTFGLTRLATHTQRSSDAPYVLLIGGTHVHHLVWGILLLLVVNYLWLVQPREGDAATFGRAMAVLYGVGAALTLDEFALWLKLRDVYWEREGRASIDAVLLFGALVSAGLWGGPFVRAVSRHLLRPMVRGSVTAVTRALARVGLAHRAPSVVPAHVEPPLADIVPVTPVPESPEKSPA
jgi:hypothetical protein